MGYDNSESVAAIGVEPSPSNQSSLIPVCSLPRDTSVCACEDDNALEASFSDESGECRHKVVFPALGRKCILS